MSNLTENVIRIGLENKPKLTRDFKSGELNAISCHLAVSANVTVMFYTYILREPGSKRNWDTAIYQNILLIM